MVISGDYLQKISLRVIMLHLWYFIMIVVIFFRQKIRFFTSVKNFINFDIFTKIKKIKNIFTLVITSLFHS